MKNKEQFLAMESIVLAAAAFLRHGIPHVHKDDDADVVAKTKAYLATLFPQKVIDAGITDYVEYYELVENGKVLVVGVQQNPIGEEDPDKLFYCEVVRISVASLGRWVEQGRPEKGLRLQDAQLVELWRTFSEQ